MKQKLLTFGMLLIFLSAPLLAGANSLTDNPNSLAPAVTNLVNSATSATGTSAITYPTGTGLPENAAGIPGVIANVLKWLLLIFGALAIIAFVISGIIYLTSAGDEDQIKKAKQAMIYAVLGVIIGLAGYVVIVTINKLLGATTATTTPATTPTTTAPSTTNPQQPTTGTNKDSTATTPTNVSEPQLPAQPSTTPPATTPVPTPATSTPTPVPTTPPRPVACSPCSNENCAQCLDWCKIKAIPLPSGTSDIKCADK